MDIGTCQSTRLSVASKGDAIFFFLKGRLSKNVEKMLDISPYWEDQETWDPGRGNAAEGELGMSH